MFEAVQDENYLGKEFLEMRFLDSVTKIFEKEKDYDKNIVVWNIIFFLLLFKLYLSNLLWIWCICLNIIQSLAVIIINKIDYKYYEIEGKECLKPKDAISPLFSIMIVYYFIK